MEEKELTTEYCPFCETEVELQTELKVQKCPNCGKYIVPCSICSLDSCVSKCPLDKLCCSLNNENTRD